MIKRTKDQHINGDMFARFYQNSGYLYISAVARRYIEQAASCDTMDIYIDPDEGFLLINMNPEGEYILSGTSGGAKVCLYAARHCGIEAGRHDITFIEDQDGLKLKVDFKASERV